MPYRVAGVPDLGYPVFEGMLATPEGIQRRPPRRGPPLMPLSDEAILGMSPEEANAAMQLREEAATAGQYEDVLRALGAVLLPLLVPATVAGGVRRTKEGRAGKIAAGAETRRAGEREREYRGQVEGLLPTPATAEEGYTPVGVARGMQAQAAQDKAAAVQAERVRNLQQELMRLENLAQQRDLSPRETESYNRIAQILEAMQKRDLFTMMLMGMMGGQGGVNLGNVQPSPMPQYAPPAGKGKTAPKGKPEKAAAAPTAPAPAQPLSLTGNRAEDPNTGEVYWQYSDGSWRNAKGKVWAQ